MIAEIISLGILSLPSVLAAVGMVPRLGILATYISHVSFSLVLWDNTDKD